MDPVDSAQGRHGRVLLREHHNSVMHTNDNMGNIISNHGNVHSNSSNANPIRSPGNPPIPKRNYPSGHTVPFPTPNSTSFGAQGTFLVIAFYKLEYY